ncbi:MAG TPA: PhoH family protein [Ectothiorhodospiraceae bacterium]|nr:PhoH family protein [Ectothiorhodospiraceae bacterium]
MPNQSHSKEITLEPIDNLRLANLCGPLDEHLRLIERRLGVEISNRGNQFNITGDGESIRATSEVLTALYRMSGESDEPITSNHVHIYLQDSGLEDMLESDQIEEVLIRTRRGVVKGRGPNQQKYLRNIMTHDINFGIGPAGTGKTYLAVACAVAALEREEVRRIILTRPAVEAGERLGFLPGDLAQKVDPYLRPLYDALYEMMGFERVAKLIERNVIEVAPLAYMRGRSLNEAFIILDEAQNTTREQMKMFLTRIGFGSTAVVTGDVTQIDLPRGTPSGLRHAVEVLNEVKGISFSFFLAKDVVRHPIVQKIVGAYDRQEQKERENSKTAGDS